MNIVIISEYESRELYVIEQIIKKYPSTIIVQPDYSISSQNKEKSKNLKEQCFELANKVKWKLHREIWDRKFYPKKSFPEVPNKIFIPSEQLNTQKGIDAIKKLNPDVLITCRAPLLKPGIIRIPKIAAVNIHYGLAPHYRGNDTLFWPLYYNDFNHLGGSIHYLTEGIDTGNILAEVYPELKPSDGEIALDIKTTKLLAKATLLFLEAVEKGEQNIDGKPQEERGRNFNNKDRTIDKSLSYLSKRALGLSRPPNRKEKIVTYF